MKISNYLRTWAVAAFLCGQTSGDAGVDIRLFGDLEGWSSYSIKLSSSGAAASFTYGPSNSGIPGRQGYRWDAATGMQDVSSPGNKADDSGTYGISGDGTVVVGGFNKGDDYNGYRWTQAGGIVSLGGSPDGLTQGEGYAASWDGGVVVGRASLYQENYAGWRAFKWTEATGMTSLPMLTGGDYSAANAVSYDGGTIAGSIRTWDGAQSATHAVIWTSSGIVTLGDFHGNDITYTEATALSGDGRTVVGRGYGPNDLEAFRWTEDTGLVGLGDLPGGIAGSWAQAVSDDGRIVVGSSFSSLGQEAFVWDELHGMRSLASILEEQDVYTGGMLFREVSSISADGSVIAGTIGNGVELKAFIITGLTIIPEPSAAGLMGLALGAVALRRRRAAALPLKSMWEWFRRPGAVPAREASRPASE